jgi:hypothetical protein
MSVSFSASRALALSALLAACVSPAGQATAVPPTPLSSARSTPSAAATSTAPPAHDTARSCPNGIHIPPGTYAVEPLRSQILVPLTMTFGTPGWKGCGLSYKELPDPQGPMMVGFWDVQDVYPDSCHWRTTPADASTGRSVADLIAAVAAQAPGEAGSPVDVTIDGFSGQYLRFEVPADVDVTDCDSAEIAEFRFWTGPGDSVWWLGASDAAGLIGEVWAIDVKGYRVAIQAASFSDAPESARDEMHRIVESIDFVP